MKREKAESNDELREQLYGPFSRGNIWPGREEVTFCQRRHYDGASPFFPKCKGAFFHNICMFPFSFSSMGMGKGWRVCACVREGRQGERASWGFVYDFVRCSFDALFSPKPSNFSCSFVVKLRPMVNFLIFLMSDSALHTCLDKLRPHIHSTVRYEMCIANSKSSGCFISS
jgi:hypothetical protein